VTPGRVTTSSRTVPASAGAREWVGAAELVTLQELLGLAVAVAVSLAEAVPVGVAEAVAEGVGVGL
jgi:hypothetical protein